MFEPIIKRADNAVEGVLTRVSGGAMAAAPLLIALGFATASAAYWADETFGPFIGNLVIAGLFLVIYVIVVAYARKREALQRARAREELASLSEASPLAAASRAFQSPDFPQALLDLAKAAAPLAARNVARVALREGPRNLPLLLGAGLGVVVASRLVGALTNGRGRH